jgi:hypothetical protein
MTYELVERSGGMILTGGKPKDSEKNLFQFYSAHQKSQTDCPDSKPELTG